MMFVWTGGAGSCSGFEFALVSSSVVSVPLSAHLSVKSFSPVPPLI